MSLGDLGHLMGMSVGLDAGITFNATTGVPINGTKGYAPSALWYNPKSGGMLYRNSGTKASSVWVPLAGGTATGPRFASGVASITGTGTVITGLNTVIAVVATSQTDLDGTTHAGVSATIGDQAGTPAAGSVILKSWKATSTSVTTLVADTTACNVNWMAIGT